MRRKLFLTSLLVTALVAFAHAKNTDPREGNGKKDEINGVISNADTKKVVKDVSVTAYINSKKEKIIVSDMNGHYVFDELKSGTYRFVFEKEGYRKVVKEKIIIKADEGFMMNIEMIEKDEDAFEMAPSPSHFFDTK
jgi:Carboxypeptidase regulatory-like domain